MTDDNYSQARRLVACKHFRWLPGMAQLGCRGTRLRQVAEPKLPPPTLPDLTDPATLGCVLALVRKAWGSPLLTTHADQVDLPAQGVPPPIDRSLVVEPERATVWSCWRPSRRGSSRAVSTECPTEAEALVAALEAAP